VKLSKYDIDTLALVAAITLFFLSVGFIAEYFTPNLDEVVS
jgi:hypothetical protein